MGWTITIKDRGGELKHDDGRCIAFGSHHGRTQINNRIDMRPMPHGMDDTAQKCIPCFIAAADILHEELSKSKVATVHCHNGNSRTSFALIVYLVRYGGLSLAEAGKLVEEGQTDRTDINFSLSRQVNNKSYWTWLNETQWQKAISDTSNKGTYRASHAVSGPDKQNHKIHHVISENRSASPVATHSPASHGIGQAEYRGLMANAAVYQGYPSGF
ncbi:hypothetical protein GCM10009092_29480 [Bowmanella denitrificans]|uniref:Tyrosine specific protein phosphatases domain-containing protein n=1 Tax=Bowmanella denitrificans TaxID=366582 RepID=A0ABP3HAM0_9ALTE